MSERAIHRNILAGILAFQIDFISREQLISAMNEWALNKRQLLEDILLSRGALDQESHRLICAIVKKHIEMHGGDATAILTKSDSLRAIRDDLESIGDLQINKTLTVACLPKQSSDDAVMLTVAGPLPQFYGRRFRIIRAHAEGGLGIVSLAHDHELNREVALKEIKARHADDPTSRSRFVLEAEITGALGHPSIVPVFSLGHTGEGRPYYAMQFITGRTFKQAIRDAHSETSGSPERGLKFLQLLKSFTDVCNAVHYAHQRGVIHRDIKPSNIILGEFGEAYLVDWGLAQRISADESVTPQSVAGTPMYMSPEQARGMSLSPRSDIYSLGATLYELLTGHAPFKFSEEQMDIQSVLSRVQEGRFDRPSDRKVDVDRVLEGICLRAMATNSEDRFNSARELTVEIDRYLSELPLRSWRRDVTYFEAMRSDNPDEVEFQISLARSYQNIGVASWGQQEFAQALQYLQSAKVILQALQQQDGYLKRDLAAVCLTLSRVHAQMRQKSAALSEYEQAQIWLSQYLEDRGREATPGLLVQIFGRSPVGFFRYLRE
jgi:serine/threonine-protein kinase